MHFVVKDVLSPGVLYVDIFIRLFFSTLALCNYPARAGTFHTVIFLLIIWPHVTCMKHSSPCCVSSWMQDSYVVFFLQKRFCGSIVMDLIFSLYLDVLMFPQ